MKIKIIYIISTLEKVGPTNQLLYLIKYIDKNLFDLCIVTLSSEPIKSNYNSFKKENVKIISLELSRLTGFFLIKNKINRIINEFKPNLVQTVGFRADRVTINKKIPKIIILRTSPYASKPFLIKPVFFGQMLANILFRFHLSFVNKNKYVLVCSKSLAEEYSIIFNKKYKYIQNGIDNQKYFSVSRAKKNKLRKKLNLPIIKKIFISLGSLNPEKNTSFIVDLFKRWVYLNNSLLVILGKGVEYETIKKRIEGSNNIKIYGEVDEVLEFVQSSDYLISASKGEGLPNAVLEGLSSGIPCLLSDIPSHKEVLNNSQAGLIFKNNNRQNLKKKIIELNDMDYTKLSINSTKHIDKYFSAKSMSIKYQNFYRKILEDHQLN